MPCGSTCFRSNCMASCQMDSTITLLGTLPASKPSKNHLWHALATRFCLVCPILPESSPLRASHSHVLLHKVQCLLLDICNCCGITVLLFILQITLEQKLHLLGGQLQMNCPLKQCFNALLLPQLDLLQQCMKRSLCCEARTLLIASGHTSNTAIGGWSTRWWPDTIWVFGKCCKRQNKCSRKRFCV